MHPLRFPNNGIRVKQGKVWLATARPHIGAVGHGQSPLQRWPTTTKVPCKGAASYGLDSPQERSTMASLQPGRG
ncbi:hypothetical protein BHM03_00054848 [Ensete ventricosum]|nr:hypothetical protein BHM03_00054848 [Ensete ventricosum]